MTDRSSTGKQRRDNLNQSEEMIRVLINATRETLLLIDIEGIVLLANEVVARRLGKSVQELTGTSLYDHFSPDVARLRKEQFYKVSHTGEPVYFEDTREDRLFETYCYPVFDMEGKVSKIAIFAHDITERKQAERKLLESEERYRVAIEHSNDGVALIRGDRHIYVNKKFLEIFGYDSPDEVIGKPHALTVHPDDLPMVRKYNRKRQRGEPAPSSYEFKGIRKDGTQIFVDISSTGTVFRGEPVTLAYFRDITERKLAEKEREKLILELQETIAKIKTLSGLLPICSSCKKIRNDKGYWEQMETYIRDHSEADFSHGLCPECAEKLYPQYYKKK
jgi:PAS domain S-box-containing protein